MRLTCPDCGATYDIPDAAIPTRGRDVMCSHCEHVWYARPEEDPAEEAPSPVVTLPVRETAPDTVFDASSGAVPHPAIRRQAPQDEEADAPSETPSETPPKRTLDPAVARILKEEAAFEAAQRAREDEVSRERLDFVGGTALGAKPAPATEDAAAPEKPAPQAPNSGPMTGETPAPAAKAPAAVTPPRVPEEAGARLRRHDAKAGTRARRAEPARRNREDRKRLGRGVKALLALGAIVFIAGLFYRFAPQISADLPGLTPALEPYVRAVDAAKAQLPEELTKELPRQIDALIERAVSAVRDVMTRLGEP
ncbi:zinc-ribbon domain-containing protein [Poseidonocella sedimentorum]|uniref:MJ0042 family finger-like domain-containing protein n=1 Tax=Poseidonocella sedimentorum TaxID=871652 RepID=A0A1I6DA74_9RHOB|nr:zinc-ribbon domain-containing protein [Poseidonocella sedimentorum]SFR02288.1 MJ0042 family finger-like domain-containing protein [Poseidonocella sedimentorum]